MLPILYISRTIVDLNGDEHYDQTWWRALGDVNQADPDYAASLEPYLDAEAQFDIRSYFGAPTFAEVDHFVLDASISRWVDTFSLLVPNIDARASITPVYGRFDTIEDQIAWANNIDDPYTVTTLLQDPDHPFLTAAVEPYYIPPGSTYYTNYFEIRIDEMQSQSLIVQY